jgi:hypothetical protein
VAFCFVGALRRRHEPKSNEQNSHNRHPKDLNTIPNHDTEQHGVVDEDGELEVVEDVVVAADADPDEVPYPA